MMPAYLPNSAAATIGGKIPIDMGKNWRDGRRIFGNGKTWRGLFGGVLSGVLLGFVQISVQNSGFLLQLPRLTILSVILLATGALFGDLVKSFFKRRLNKKQGEEWLFADQYDLVAGAFLLLLVFDFPWFVSVMTIPILVAILIITPLLHRIVNIIGYTIGVKEVPW